MYPTKYPTPTPKPCFTSWQELRNAIEDYLAAGAAGNNNQANSPVAQMYGYPMGNWCISLVSDMSWLFADLSNFDDASIGDWDVGHVTDMSFMFYKVSTL